jgi:hypothetical protein
MGNTGDQYVSGGVNWAAFTLEELVGMVSDQASVPQLQRLADDWRETGDGMITAADHLAGALDDLMGFWSGASAEQARNAVALNAQWVGDLGTTAREMGDPIDEAAGALKSAQDAMPELPPARALPGSAPQGAADAAVATEGSSLGAAVGATAAGSESAFEARAEQEDLLRIAIETMQRFEAAALGIDQATPQFEGQSDVLRPRADDVDVTRPRDTGGDGDAWTNKVDSAKGVDERWQALTGLTDTGTTAARGSAAAGDLGGFTGGGAIGGDSVVSAPLSGGGTLGGVPERVGGGARPGVPVMMPGGVAAAGGSTPGPMGPMGAPMGGGAGADSGGQHRRRVPYEGDDPFETGEQVSKPVIGL